MADDHFTNKFGSRITEDAYNPNGTTISYNESGTTKIMTIDTGRYCCKVKYSFLCIFVYLQFGN